MSIPLVLHIPHSSRHIPPEERASLALSDAELNAELLKMTDAYTDELFPVTHFEAGRVVHQVSRLLCDPERFPDDAQEPMAAKGMGALYTLTSAGTPLRRPIPPEERQRLLETYYRPHHQQLEHMVEQVLGQHERCIIVDCHSFSDKPYPHEPDQDPNRPEICLGTDPFHTPNWLRDRAVETVRALGWSVLVDRPFAGALVPLKSYHKDKRVLALMIEINRKLYMDESTGQRTPIFDQVVQGVRVLLTALAQSETTPGVVR